MLFGWGSRFGGTALNSTSSLVQVLLQHIFCASPTLGDDAVFARAGATATVTDWEGIVRPTLANEIRFPGFRRVHNLWDLIATEWIDSNTTTTAEYDFDGWEPITRIQGTASTNWNAGKDGAVSTQRSFAVGTVVRVSMWMRTTSGTGSNTLRGQIDSIVQNPTVTVTGSWQRFSWIYTVTAGGTGRKIGISRDASQTACDVLIKKVLVEDVTGQANTNPSEYVSVGVGTGDELVDEAESASHWTAYGSNTVEDTADGVKVTYVDSGEGAYMYFQDERNLSQDLVFNKTYIVACQVKVNTGTVLIVAHDQGGDKTVATINSTSFVPVYFTILADNFDSGHYMRFSGMGAGEAIWVKDISVKEADHGAFVDGVKYFANTNNASVDGSGVVTENTSTTALTSVVPQGLLMEPGSTNLVTRSDDLTLNTSAWAAGLAASIGSATSIYGDLQNCEVTLSASGAQSIYTQDITVSASTEYTFSFYAKKGTMTDWLLAIRDQTAAAWIDVNVAFTPGTGEYTRITHTFTTPVGCVAVRLYPMRNNTSTGTVYIGGVMLEQKSFASSLIYTYGGTAQRNTETLYYTGITFPQTAGFALVNLEFGVASADFSGQSGILSATSGDKRNVLYANGVNLTSWDSTNIDSMSFGTNANEDIVCASRWDSNGGTPLEVGKLVNGTWHWTGSPAAYDGGFASNGKLSVALDPIYPTCIKGILLSSTEKTTAEIEALYPTFACSES